MTFDTLIIGAGMSGLSAAVRLSHFGKKVILVEQHARIGGLNSFYERNGLKLETGLHAMTNFCHATDSKHHPLLKLLRQLRIPYDALQLREQQESSIVFPQATLKFSNNFELLKSQIESTFPQEFENFLRLDLFLSQFNSTDLNLPFQSTRKEIQHFIHDPLLIDMLLAPLLYYGSAIENDIDFAQFAIMYQSIYKEGFCRPGDDGIRSFLQLFFQRIQENGGILQLKSRVKQIELDNQNKNAVAVILTNGQRIECKNILSTIGAAETLKLLPSPLIQKSDSPRPGNLGYWETIVQVTPQQLEKSKIQSTIQFFNTTSHLNYAKPQTAVDFHSGVICFPSRFQFTESDQQPPSFIRLTLLANSQFWLSLPIEEYKTVKKQTESHVLSHLESMTNLPDLFQNNLFIDSFTPKTIHHFTGHLNGAIYGSPDKQRDGKTIIPNLFLCGTDQGFLGIVGATLSGISIANKYLLN